MTHPAASLAPSVYPQHPTMPDDQRPTRYAIIPTHNRLAELTRLLGQLEHWADFVIILDNASEPPVSEVELRVHHPRTQVVVVSWPEQPPHLYRMWNAGFEAAKTNQEAWHTGPYDIAVLNDDTLLPDGWCEYVGANLRHHGAAAASTYPFPTSSAAHLKTSHDGNIVTRMCPWAFMLRGEAGLRADESFRWWWGDTDLDWQACEKGGVLLLPGPVPANTLANSTTVGALAEQAGRDGETFTRKWGHRPW